MKKFFLNIILGITALLLTVGLFFVLYEAYFSDWVRTFDVMIMTFAIVLYSNFLALAYGYIRVRTI
jgi:hypothetical protein